MATGSQDCNGFPGSLAAKATPVVADSIEIIDSADSNKPKVATLNSLPFAQTTGGVVPLAEGGTNHALTADNGGIVYSDATKLDILAHTTTAQQMLQSGNAAAPSWSTATWPTTTTINQILWSSAANTVTGLATANSAILYTSSTGVPAWSASLTNGQLIIGSTGASPVIGSLTAGSGVTITPGAGTITIAATGSGGTVTSVSGTLNRITSTGGATPVIDISASYVGQSSITTLGTITTGTWNGTIIDLSHGGTNANLTASNGGIFYSTATAGAVLAGTATARQMLQSGASGAPAWSTATYPATTTVSRILYSSSANVVGEITTANSAMLVTNSTGVPAMTATMTNGQLIIGNTGGTPTPATLTQGTGITITNGAGTITIAASGSVAGIVQTATATVAAASTLSLAQCFSATYDNYIVMLENFICSNNGVTLSALIGTGAGPTYQNTNYDSSGSISTQINISNGATFGNTPNSPLNGYFFLFNTQNASNWKGFMGASNYTNGTSTFTTNTITSIWKQATALTSLQIQISGGTMTTGTVKVYGFVN